MSGSDSVKVLDAYGKLIDMPSVAVIPDKPAELQMADTVTLMKLIGSCAKYEKITESSGRHDLIKDQFFTFEALGLKASVLFSEICGWIYRTPIEQNSNATGIVYLKGGQSIAVDSGTCIELEKIFDTNKG